MTILACCDHWSSQVPSMRNRNAGFGCPPDAGASGTPTRAATGQTMAAEEVLLWAMATVTVTRTVLTVWCAGRIIVARLGVNGMLLTTAAKLRDNPRLRGGLSILTRWTRTAAQGD